MGSGDCASGDWDVAPIAADLHPLADLSTEVLETGRSGSSSTAAAMGQAENVADRVRVRVLGQPTIDGVPADHHVRPQALEFLTYLIVRGGSAWQDEIFDDLMPEPPRRLAAQRLHTYTYNLRRTFTLIGGERTYLRLKRHHYVLNRDAFDVDLWAMRDAVAEATAGEAVAKAAALRRAVQAYGGPLAAGTKYLWIVRYRESARQEYVQAAVALAAELALRTEDARSVLAVALRHHPDDRDLAVAADRVRG